uniref:MFS domain-containing protein n=1 Tax=Parastrongyloides trichosuri TaxID=131310 RepID=A0A0N4ZIJ2_PARTI
MSTDSTQSDSSKKGQLVSEVKSTSTTSEVKKVTFEDFFKRGTYTYILCGLLQFMILFQLGNMIFMTYGGLPPKIVGCGSKNFTELGWKEETICEYIEKREKNETCKPIFESAFDSINMEWNYICSRQMLIKSSTFFQLIGIFFGSIAGGQLSDLFGRKTTMLISLLIKIALTFLSSFSQDLTQLNIIRLAIQFLNGMTITINGVFIVENIPKNDRIWVYNIFTWSPTTAIFAIIAYFANEWRLLARVVAFLSIPAVILLVISAKSPRWLIQKGRLEEAKKEIKKICKLNKRDIDEKDISRIVQEEYDKSNKVASESKKKYTFLHLFYTWKFTTYTLILSSTFFVASLANYGTLFNMERLSGSIYTNSILMGCLRYIINLIVAAIDPRFKWLGRRHILIVFCFAITASCVGIFFVNVLGLSMEMFKRVLQISVVAYTSQLYLTSGIVSSELFPTPIRNLSYSTLQASSRIGVIISPYLFVLRNIFDSAPYAVLGIITGGVGTLYIFYIPETKGQPLKNEMPGPEESICGNKSILKQPEEVPDSVTSSKQVTQTLVTKN